MTSRRGFLRGLVGVATIAAAPAIIREGFAMPVKAGLCTTSLKPLKDYGDTIEFVHKPRAVLHPYYTNNKLHKDFPEFSKQRLAALEEEAAVFSGLKGDMIIDSSEPVSPEHLERALIHERVFGGRILNFSNRHYSPVVIGPDTPIWIGK